MLIALSADSKQQVDELADKAIAAGGKKSREPEDHGFMHARSFKDLDGQVWEIIWINPAYIQLKSDTSHPPNICYSQKILLPGTS